MSYEPVRIGIPRREKAALLKVEPVTIGMHEAGIDLAERYRLSMIASAALLSDCDTLLSEDLQNGLLITGRLRVGPL